MENYLMADSFLHNHQSALDSQREDDAIQYLQDCGVYPDPDDKTVKNLELNALNTIYRSMKWAETNNEPELAVKYANLYITNKKRLKK